MEEINEKLKRGFFNAADALANYARRNEIELDGSSIIYDREEPHERYSALIKLVEDSGEICVEGSVGERGDVEINYFESDFDIEETEEKVRCLVEKFDEYRNQITPSCCTKQYTVPEHIIERLDEEKWSRSLCRRSL